jgi:AcrR family transcriptional regulator
MERKRAARMAMIERTAARAFAERGYDGANFDDIAAELDLRGSSLYYYFASKDDLFLRCVRHSAAQVFERLRRIATATGSATDPTPVLRALIREQVLIEVRDFPEFVPLFFKMSVPVPAIHEEILALRREHATIFEDLLSGRNHPGDHVATRVRVWLGTTFGALAYLPEWYDPAGPMGVEELASVLADALVDAFPA